MKPLFSSPGRALPALALAALLAVPAGLQAQDSSSSSGSSSGAITPRGQRPLGPRPTVEAAGSGTSMQVSEPMFYIASALNACGYDTGLERSAPVRAAVRAEISQALATSATAQASRDRMCNFITQHRSNDNVQNIAQYVYLALYTTAPPELTTTMSDTDMVPAAADVVNLLPLLRTFAEAVQLHLIWVKHHADYVALQEQVHDPLTKMILDTNSYLRLPVSNYDGRRFLVLLEPMLAPAQTNALEYDVNYFVVTSPSGGVPATVKLDDVRHSYLHYQIEPMMRAKSNTLDNFLPLLRHEQQAPVDFLYQTDITELLTECLIKAVEVHLMDTGLVPPPRPDTRDLRAATDYNNAMNAYNRQTEITRRAAVDRAMRQGWAVTQYFYEELNTMNHAGTPLQEGIGPMLFGMEVEREREREARIVFDARGGQEIVAKRAPAHVKTEIETAQEKLGTDPTGAEQIAKKVLADPAGDHGGAEYTLGVLSLILHQDPDAAATHFNTAIEVSKDLRTVSWSHIYLGRIYDTVGDRARALREYQAAISTRDGKPDTFKAAMDGTMKPYGGVKRVPIERGNNSLGYDGDPVDPTGKAEKDSYRPAASPK